MAAASSVPRRPDIVRADESGLRTARRLLARGEIVAIPTYRWYLLVVPVDAFDRIETVYDAKGRDRSASLLCLVSDLDHAKTLVDVPEPDGDDRRWPSCLAIRATKRYPFGRRPAVDDTSALVGSPSAVAAALASGAPLLAATSVNRSGDRPAASATEVADVAVRIGLPIRLVLDGGRATLRRELTIVTYVGGLARIERSGACSVSALRARGWFSKQLD